MSKNRKLYGCVLAAAIMVAVLCVHFFNRTPEIAATPPAADVAPPSQSKAGELIVGISSVIEVPAVDQGSPPVPPSPAVAARDEGETAPDALAGPPGQSLAAPD